MKAAFDQRVVALVPMRHQSVRVAGKNFRNLGGVPLFHHILATLSDCESIADIVVDTDSPTIKEDLNRSFSEVLVIDRPSHLCGDDVPMTEILFHDTSQIPADLYIQTHSTNPFLKRQTIEAALESWLQVRHLHDSLFSVTQLQARLWDSTGRPLNHNPWLLFRTQDLAPIYLENSNFYIFTPELIRSSRRRIGDRPKLYPMDPLESIDIDDEQSFALAEQLMRARQSVET